MGFKMKTPSTHEGTERHRQEIKQYKELQVNRTMDGTSLPDGRPGSSPAQFKPTISLKPKKKDLLGSDKMISDLQKKTNDALFKIKTANMTKKQKKKLNKSLAADKKFIEDAKKNIGTDKKTKYDKPGTVVSRAAEKVGETLNPWSIKNRAKRQEKRAARKADPQGTAARKKARSTKIADSIEYLFMDGQRPDERQAARDAAAAKAAMKAQKLKNKKKKQDKLVNDKTDDGGSSTETKKIYDYKKGQKVSWEDASAASGGELNNWVSQRDKHKKGSKEYNQIQNKINEALNDPTRHPVE